MLRYALTSVAALLLSASLNAENTEQYFASRILDDQAARNYLEVDGNADYEAFSRTKLLRGDVNGDNLSDYVVIAHHDRSAVVSAFIADESESLKDAAYAGYISIDSKKMPVVRLSDVTGNGTVDIRIETTRKQAGAALRRVLKFASFNEEKSCLKTIFLAMLDDVEREGLNKSRSTHLIRIKDADKDGTNEIEVSTRNVELVGKDRKEREIAESVAMTKTTYAFKDGKYEFTSTKTTGPTLEERLVVASKLSRAGEHQRAALTAHAILRGEDLPKAVLDRARTILATDLGRSDEVVVDAGSSSNRS